MSFISTTRGLRLLVFLFLLLNLPACATYQHKLQKARNLLSHEPAEAAKLLQKDAETEGKDQLVYLYDYGTALQVAGDYKESTNILLKADSMADVKDYYSISKQAASLITSQEMVPYKGEDYEKLVINAMLAINFLMQNDLDGALVETRRINEKLEYYRIEQKKQYEQNAFAVYLSALIWEADKKWDDAYIAYEKAYKLNPDVEYLKKDLIRSAYRARRKDTQRKWEKQFGMKFNKSWIDPNQGELVLIYQQGWGPRKYPHPNWRRIPKLNPVYVFTAKAELSVGGKVHAKTEKIYSVQDVAIKTLDDQYAGIIAKRMAGLVAKKAVKDRLAKEDNVLAQLTSIAMHVSDRADLRQWSTLPASFQIAKIRLSPGQHKIHIQGLDESGRATNESSEREVNIVKGKKTFTLWRSFY